MAYQSVNGRFYAGKQAQCKFVGITRWKVAICGEFMKSKLQTCSRGTACNFIHCFRNPGGDYEWADWDKPPPKYWLNKMAALFGDSDEYRYGKQIERGSPRLSRRSSRISADDDYRYRFHRSQSREIHDSRNSRKCSEESSREHIRTSVDRKQLEALDTDRKIDSRGDKSYEMSSHNSNGESDSDDFNHHRRKRGRGHQEKKHERYHGQDIIKKGRKQKQGSLSPDDDHWDDRVSTYSSDDKMSTRQHADKRKHSRMCDYSETELDNTPRGRGPSYRSSDSSRRYCAKDSTKLGRSSNPSKQYSDHVKKSKSSCSIDEEGIDKRGRWEPNDYDR